MARRPAEEVITVVLDRKAHAHLKELQQSLRLRTISDALEVAVKALRAADIKPLAERELTS